MKNINIELSIEESLVLFDLLSRYEDKDKIEIIDNSENIILWKILTILEKKLSEPFCPNYLEIIKKAREKINNNNPAST